MTNQAVPGDVWIEVRAGIRKVGYLLCGLGAIACSGVALVLLMTLTLPGIAPPTPAESVLLVVLLGLASAPLIAGGGLLTLRSWAPVVAEGSLLALVPAGLIVLVTLGQMFAVLLPVGLPALLAALWAVAYLRRPVVRYVYRSIAGPAPLPPVRVVGVASRLAPASRILGGLGLIGLGAISALGAITVRPDASSAWAEMGATFARLFLEIVAAIWFGSGLFALLLRNSVIPAAIGAFLTLPLAAYMLAWAPPGLSLLPGSVGLMLALSVPIRLLARSRDELAVPLSLADRRG